MEYGPTKTLLIGAAHHPEFAEPVRYLAERTDLDRAPTVAAALDQWRRRGEAWQIVIFAQARPGQFESADIERVHRAMPLTRLAALLGSWCEGESRSGHPWPGVQRVYWHQWTARWAGSRALDATPTGWMLPRTASPIEQMQDALHHPQPGFQGTVAIATTRSSFYDALAHACCDVGLRVIRFGAADDASPATVDIALWEPCAVRGHGWEQLAEVVAQYAPAPVIALLNFPRYHDLHHARELGAADVLTCPFLLPDLWASMHAVLNH